MSELGAWFESLWAPWRIEYLERESKSDFLREAAEAANDADYLVVCRRKAAFLMMNLYPYAPGHLMVVPYRMISRLAELTDDEKIELMDLASYAERLLRRLSKLRDLMWDGMWALLREPVSPIIFTCISFRDGTVITIT